jgi:hypothetical protein
MIVKITMLRYMLINKEYKQVYYFRVSSLSHIMFCAKRAKLEIFNNLAKIPYVNNPKNSIVTGNRLHREYSYYNRSFDRVRVKALLGDKVFQKELIYGDYKIILRGLYDDLRVITVDGKKYTVLIELKTTTKKYMWSREVNAAIKQLQLYMYLLKERLEVIGYPLWRRGYLMRRIVVEYDDNIEEWIKDAVDKFNGLSKVSIPPYRYCKLCPTQVKSNCSWYYVRSKKI